MKTTLILTITHTKPIPDLADKVAGRAYVMDGIEDVEATESRELNYTEADCMESEAKWCRTSQPNQTEAV